MSAPIFEDELDNIKRDIIAIKSSEPLLGKLDRQEMRTCIMRCIMN